MELYDKNWSYCGTNGSITQANLNPGDFIFKFKKSNSHNLRNKNGFSVKIQIILSYLKTMWFKGLSFLRAIRDIGNKYRLRVEKLKKQSKAQEEFSRKLIEVQEDEKERIAHELHYTIVHEILMFKQKAMMALKHRDDKVRMEKTLEEISELSSATITEVRNIAYNLHPHQLANLGFTKTIKSIINKVSGSTNLNFIFETDNVDELFPKECEINLFRLIQETITNIIKNSQATEIILKVSKSEDHLLILFVDNGKGILTGKEFADDMGEFGISTIMERLRIMNGEISIDSEINKGTSLRYKIPLKNENG
ncbi:MAG: histidine kinase [Bacteroidota bacterium]|nr:histidine kinase [Bacteroidota bacterium]